MIDFTKRLQESEKGKSTNPIDIYETLDRSHDKGPLRPSQTAILNKWFSSRKDESDLIVKLHTGQGKTLIGLLILKSRLNSKEGPVVYVCPNIYLAEQTREQAKQFGIKTCDFDSANNLPDEFWSSSAILVTYVQKMFNGLSKFGIGSKSIDVNTIILDDSHACIDSIDSSFTLSIPSSSELFDEIITEFKDALEQQGFAKFQEILSSNSSEVMVVPYWAWNDMNQSVIKSILKYKNEKFVLFTWPLIRDIITSCYCYVSSDKIEIKPFLNPIEMFGTFSKAKHRVMMSATTNNDAFFIKSLGLNSETIENPIVYEKEKWSGEKLIIIPYQIDPQLNRTTIVNWLSKKVEGRNLGLVALTPSFNDANYWASCGAEVADSDSLNSKIEKLKKGDCENTIVFANRYDGIDLPDDSCRILVIDNKPFGQTLEDKYYEDVRSNSELINIKVAQKIEQGLGRGVRGEKDYCFILLTGSNLVGAIKNPKFKKFFSPQTQQQIHIGLEVTKYAVEDTDKKEPTKIVKDAMNQVLQRDEGWKSFYKHKMDEIDHFTSENNVLQILEIEREAEIAYEQGDFPKAKEMMWSIVEKFYKDDKLEKGYYEQEMARMIYPMSKSDSNKIQISAHRDNRSLLKPKDGMLFKKLEIEGNRVERIIEFVSQFEDYSNLISDLEITLGELNFHPNTKRFEIALENIGKQIGFSSERPEKAWKEGPDNLWCISPGKYFLFECKTGTKLTRAEIYQKETEQLLNSNRWFEEKYVDCDSTPILIINPKMVAKGAFLPDNGKILNQNGLNKLKSRIRAFYKEFSGMAFEQIPQATIQNWLKTHELDHGQLKTLLIDPIYYKEK